MNKKHLIILTVILAVLGALVTFKQSQKPPELVKEEYAPLDLSFDAAAVTKITLSKKDETSKVEILKEKEEWLLPGFSNARANRDKIDTFLKEIREAKGEVRGRSQSVFKDFGITDEEALNVVLFNVAGSELLSFKIGTKKADYGTLFIRKKTEETVYLTGANLLSAAGVYGDLNTDNPSSPFWAAGNFMTVDPVRVLSLKTVRYPGGKETVTANVRRPDPGGAWASLLSGTPSSLSAGLPLSGEKIRGFLQDAKAWSAQEAMDPKAQDYGFSKPFWILEAGLDGGETFKITVSHPKEGAEYFAEVTGEPVVFKLPEYLAKTMDIDESRFIGEDPLGAGADKIEKLVLRADKKEWNLQPKENKSEVVTNYLNDLKNFRVNRFLLDAADEKKAAGVNQVEIQKTGEPVKILEIGEALNSENGKEYAARIRGASPAFAIAEGTFKQLFENPDRFNEPAPAK